jgi:hypothetical protein
MARDRRKRREGKKVLSHCTCKRRKNRSPTAAHCNVLLSFADALVRLRNRTDRRVAVTEKKSEKKEISLFFTRTIYSPDYAYKRSNFLLLLLLLRIRWNLSTTKKRERESFHPLFLS